MKLYLAGPMRGYPLNNAAAFQTVATALRAFGHEVWSPSEADGGLVPDSTVTDRQAIFRRDCEALLQQDAIVLMDGWNRSHGACLEKHLADVVGMPVFMFSAITETGLIALTPHDWRWRAEK